MTDETVAPTDTITVSVRGLTIQCWKCRRETVAVVGLHPTADPDPLGSFVRCDNEETLATAARMLRDAGRRELARPIKQRQSRTTGTAYLSNGCQHCDALQGNFFLFHEELMEVLPVNGLDGLDHLADAGIPAAQWWHLYNRSL